MTWATATRGKWWVPAFLLGGMALVVLSVLNPSLILDSSTPTGGDMGAHVFGPAYLRDVLLPQGRVLGWSQSWFAGFPVFYFYFPLPSLVIVLLDVFLPYGVAFKIVTVAGLAATPVAAYYLAGSLRIGRMTSVVAASSGVVFVFMESFTIYGGNVASTLAGEFTFSWSFAFSLVYLGHLIRGMRDDRRHLVWAAVFLALTALCHIITTIVVVVASIPVLFWKGGSRTLGVWAGGFALAAFWALPLLASVAFSSDMGWTPLRTLEEILPVEIWLLLPLALGGVIWLARRTPRVVPIIIMTFLPLVYYPLPNLITEAFPELFTDSRWKLWNGRLLPYWYFGVAFLAGTAVGVIARWVTRQLPGRVSAHVPRGLFLGAGLLAVYLAATNAGAPQWLPWAIGVVTVAVLGGSLLWPGPALTRSVTTSVAVSVLALGALAGVSFVSGWARWNYAGYEAKDPWPEYEEFMGTMSGLEPGRVQWEYSKDHDRFGTTMSLMLIPYWTGPEHASMEGLFFESSLTVPFHFLNQAEMSFKPSAPVSGLQYRTFDFDRGIPHLGLYGVDYYVAYTEEAIEKADGDSRLDRIGTTGPFVLYQLPETSLVEPLAYEVPVYSGESFHDFALDWYDEVDNLDRPVVREGPDDLPEVRSLGELDDLAPAEESGEVTDIVLEDHRVSFRTTAVGVPHLVKVSYFPNWIATGADGPYHATPSLMVVIPTDEEVVLEFGRRWTDILGMTLTGVAVLWLVAYGVRRRTRAPTESSDPA